MTTINVSFLIYEGVKKSRPSAVWNLDIYNEILLFLCSFFNFFTSAETVIRSIDAKRWPINACSFSHTAWDICMVFKQFRFKLPALANQIERAAYTTGMVTAYNITTHAALGDEVVQVVVQSLCHVTSSSYYSISQHAWNYGARWPAKSAKVWWSHRNKWMN